MHWPLNLSNGGLVFAGIIVAVSMLIAQKGLQHYTGYIADRAVEVDFASANTPLPLISDPQSRFKVLKRVPRTAALSPKVEIYGHRKWEADETESAAASAALYSIWFEKASDKNDATVDGTETASQIILQVELWRSARSLRVDILVPQIGEKPAIRFPWYVLGTIADSNEVLRIEQHQTFGYFTAETPATVKSLCMYLQESFYEQLVAARPEFKSDLGINEADFKSDLVGPLTEQINQDFGDVLLRKHVVQLVLLSGPLHLLMYGLLIAGCIAVLMTYGDTLLRERLTYIQVRWYMRKGRRPEFIKAYLTRQKRRPKAASNRALLAAHSAVASQSVGQVEPDVISRIGREREAGQWLMSTAEQWISALGVLGSLWFLSLGMGSIPDLLSPEAARTAIALSRLSQDFMAAFTTSIVAVVAAAALQLTCARLEVSQIKSETMSIRLAEAIRATMKLPRFRRRYVSLGSIATAIEPGVAGPKPR